VSCLLLIDLDRFKELVNDRTGRELGERSFGS
jgi:GGDEF domain-containing protein